MSIRNSAFASPYMNPGDTRKLLELGRPAFERMRQAEYEHALPYLGRFCWNKKPLVSPAKVYHFLSGQVEAFTAFYPIKVEIDYSKAAVVIDGACAPVRFLGG